MVFRVRNHWSRRKTLFLLLNSEQMLSWGRARSLVRTVHSAQQAWQSKDWRPKGSHTRKAAPGVRVLCFVHWCVFSSMTEPHTEQVPFLLSVACAIYEVFHSVVSSPHMSHHLHVLPASRPEPRGVIPFPKHLPHCTGCPLSLRGSFSSKHPLFLQGPT